MLFSYKYVPHKMDQMQRFINFIFYQVWCRAHKAGVFNLNLFDKNQKLKEVMTSFFYDHTQGGDFFYGHVEGIYDLFAGLNRTQIAQLKRWYQANNNIEKICANDPTTLIARYTDIQAVHPALSKQLAVFFKGLYSQQLLDLATLREKIGKIDGHYKAFMGKNKVSKCPFCGISDMLDANHTPREAYDHYLPKKLYPFNSINFRNLVPACHHCNSSYKTSKDPAFTPKDPAGAIERRKVFYPYANHGHRIEVTIELRKPDVDQLEKNDIQLAFGPPMLNEEIETWKDVYGIEERYKAKCCSADARDWLEQIRILRDAHGLDPEASLKALQQQTDKDQFANSNFFKKAFLDGCQKAGLF